MVQNLIFDNWTGLLTIQIIIFIPFMFKIIEVVKYKVYKQEYNKLKFY
jgi:hypothetical protein